LKNINSAFHNIYWPVQNVLAFTTTIHHPNQIKYKGQYGDFNLGLHVGDDTTFVQDNRQVLLSYLPSNTHIQWLEQVHSNHAEYIHEHCDSIIADASITNQKGIALAIMTADCLPIVIASRAGEEVANIHGGWKPLSKQIIQHTVSQMKTPLEELYVWLGPCIGAEAFEVGEDVYSQFIKIDSRFSPAFTSIHCNTKKNKYLANLHAIATIQLNTLGIYNISALPHCTFSQKNDYYSYRRQNITGRMATIICRI